MELRNSGTKKSSIEVGAPPKKKALIYIKKKMNV